MQSQQKYWDDAHAKRQLQDYSKTQTSFAEETNSIIPSGSHILELGCGEGNDSIYLAQQGHAVIATDFSDVVIAGDQQSLTHPKLQFSVQDISQPLNYSTNSFDVVYARLSLHYFTSEQTEKIFSEIARVLKPNGYLCFMCKSVNDRLYGQGKKIEDNMYELAGHVRHFFSEKLTRELLAKNGFTVISLEHGKDKLYARESAFIKVIAQKQ